MATYDEVVVNSRVDCFKKMNYAPEEVTLYFDMDNTLCLFSPFGDVNKSLANMYSKGFYRELLCFPEAPAVIENLQKVGFTVKILSSCINSEYCMPEKKAWINYHLPTIRNSDILLVPEGESKIPHISYPQSSILIDDFYINISGMYEAGGVGIKKTFSGKKRVIPQISSLVDIFGVLHSLHCI